MTRPRQLLALLFALLLAFPACTEGGGEVTDEGAVSASATEYIPPEISEEVTASPPETSSEVTAEEATEYQTTIADLPPDLILEVSEKLSNVYRSCRRTSHTETVINVHGEETRSELDSELCFSYGNAHFTRTDADRTEEIFLIDGYLCYSGKCGNYRLGGYDYESFSELVGYSFPLAAFSGGKKELDGEELILTYDSMNETGRAAILAMLGFGEDYSVEFTRASLTVCTDLNGNQKSKEMVIGFSVSRDGCEQMKVLLSSVTEQTEIGKHLTLELPSVAEYTLFPDGEAIALYESLAEDLFCFAEEWRAFEFTEIDEMRLSSESLGLTLSSSSDHAYAESIGASIESNFDLADGTGKHRVLTHFNRHHGFSQIDGGSIFVDRTINADNLLDTLMHPIESVFLPLSLCESTEGLQNGRLAFALNEEAVKRAVRDVLLHTGTSDEGLSGVKASRAELFIQLGGSGEIASVGYTVSARVTLNGEVLELSRTHRVDITSRGSARVKVIYIEVDEDDE